MMHDTFSKIYTLYFAHKNVVGSTETKSMLYIVAKRFPVGFFKLSMFVLKQEIEIRYVIKENISRKNYIVIILISRATVFMFLVIKHLYCGIKIFT